MPTVTLIKMEKLVFIFMLFSLNCFGQFSDISGNVKDKDTGEPILFAHIFIANTAVGSTSDTEGKFMLREVPAGEFTIVCTMVGYDPFTGLINVTPGNLFQVDIELEQSETILDEVSVSEKEDKKWKKQYSLFERELLGDVPTADRCEILNPWVVNFEENSFSDTFLATADEPLEINNKYLGYKIYFLLTNFKIVHGQLTYLGYPSFQALELNEMDRIENFLRNREEIYKGSTRHFFDALIHNRIKQEGFRLYKVFSLGNDPWPDNVSEAVSRGLLQSVDPSDIMKKGSGDTYTVHSDDVLEIIYTGKKWGRSPYRDSPFQVSRISFNEPLTVAAHGYVFNSASFVVYGYLAEERIASMLPYEYGKEIQLMDR